MPRQFMAFDRWLALAPEEREQLDAESERLDAAWHRELDELDWRLGHDLPETFYGVLREYEERGAPLGDPFTFLPPEARDVYVLRRFGPASLLGQQVEALEGMETALLTFAPYCDALTFERFWSRLVTLRRRAEAAEERLRAQGYALGETGVLGFIEGTGRPTKWGNAAVRRAYHHMKPRYEAAWPDDTWNGAPTKSPARLREHIRLLLRPWVGDLPDDRVDDAITNG